EDKENIPVEEEKCLMWDNFADDDSDDDDDENDENFDPENDYDDDDDDDDEEFIPDDEFVKSDSFSLVKDDTSEPCIDPKQAVIFIFLVKQAKEILKFLDAIESKQKSKKKAQKRKKET
ncbi:hypothetical protein RFI_18031, partial [Reticulomyxa filosa]